MAYMAPEVHAGRYSFKVGFRSAASHPHSDVRVHEVDMYAGGVMMMEMAGVELAMGHDAHAANFERHRGRFRDYFSLAFTQLLERMISRVPDDRPDAAYTLAQLRQCQSAHQDLGADIASIQSAYNSTTAAPEAWPCATHAVTVTPRHVWQ